MPWWRRRWRRPWRRYWRRARAPLRRRYWRRRWVRKRKKPKINLIQFQPKCIRKCKIFGPTCLFATTKYRLSNDYDLYEYSEIPELLPGGGGWGIKVFSLDALYSDHEYARNCWTRDNHDLPLVRYLGCSLTFYQSEYVDYIVTYTNSLPMKSSLGMYNSMQPIIQYMQQHKLIVPSIKTYRKRKPYFKLWVKPPNPLQNKWYFAQDISRTPLVMIRTTTTSLNKFFIDPDNYSNCITIHSLNASIFQNRDFAHPDQGTQPGYWAYKKDGSQKVYLYASTQEPPSQTPKAMNLIPLYDTQNYEIGHSYADIYPSATSHSQWEQQWKTTTWKTNMGNPFASPYLQGDIVTYQSTDHYTKIMNENTPTTEVKNLSFVSFIKKQRYCPNLDQTHDHIAYFKCNQLPETGWTDPDDEQLTNSGLPYWLLLWGFCDWHRKVKKYKHLDSEYILCIKQHVNLLTRDYVIPLSQSFINGRSPFYTDTPPRSEADSKTWYPQLQYQTEAINEICLTGPGVAKIPENFSVQGLLKYKFYFKWGGDLPQMSTIENPRQLPTYILPGNQYSTNSLQNPTTNAEALLYSFDERRHTLTQRALKRLQTYKDTKTDIITDGSPYQDEPALQEAQEETTSSEEEETETLFQQLQLQRRKQKQLRLRILKTLQQLQKSE
nr:MAG: ORF1 [TTV-like mini virus]